MRKMKPRNAANLVRPAIAIGLLAASVSTFIPFPLRKYMALAATGNTNQATMTGFVSFPFQQGSGTPAKRHCHWLDTNRFVVFYRNASSQPSAAVVTVDSAGAPTLGTALTLVATNTTILDVLPGRTNTLEFLVACGDNNVYRYVAPSSGTGAGTVSTALSTITTWVDFDSAAYAKLQWAADTDTLVVAVSKNATTTAKIGLFTYSAGALTNVASTTQAYTSASAPVAVAAQYVSSGKVNVTWAIATGTVVAALRLTLTTSTITKNTTAEATVASIGTAGSVANSEQNVMKIAPQTGTSDVVLTFSDSAITTGGASAVGSYPVNANAQLIDDANPARGHCWRSGQILNFQGGSVGFTNMTAQTNWTAAGTATSSIAFSSDFQTMLFAGGSLIQGANVSSIAA